MTELTSENLAEHVRGLAQNEDLDGSFSREELFAMGSILLLGADKDSDLSLRDIDDMDDVGNEDE